MKKFPVVLMVVLLAVAGCKKYSDAYLNPSLPKTLAYFASFQEYTRTVVVGEGLSFKIGPAMAGVLNNTIDRTVDLQIGTVLNMTSPKDTRILLPPSYYNAGKLGSPIRVTIPAGQFVGYFTIQFDSVSFLSDPISMYKSAANEGYTIPVKIIGTSLDSIEKGLDSIKVSVKYIAGQDGYYLYNNVVTKEVAGVILTDKTVIDSAVNESDNSAWRLLTQGPFKVKVTSATSAFTNGLNFNLYIDGNKNITYESITGQPVVTSEGTNSYSSKTRDFVLNYHYQKAGITDTIYHVSSKLLFRNRILDKVNETREYLSYFNN